MGFRKRQTQRGRAPIDARVYGDAWVPIAAQAYSSVSGRADNGPLGFECPHCGALADEPCETPSGALAKDFHAARKRLADGT